MLRFEDQESSNRLMNPQESQSIDSKVRIWQSQNENIFKEQSVDSNHPPTSNIKPTNSAAINKQPRSIRAPSLHSIHSNSHSVNTSSFYTSPSSMASRRSIAATPKLASIPKKFKPAFPSDQEILAELRCLLNDLDLSSTTKKQVRVRLEGKFQCDLSSKKNLISTYINQLVGK